MSKESEYQEKLAVEFISHDLCKECPHYYFDANNKVCLFTSNNIEKCNIVRLDIKGELIRDGTPKKL